MHDKLIIKIKHRPAGNDRDEWHAWHAEVGDMAREILAEISTRLASTADESTIRLLKDQRTRVLSIMSLAMKLLNDAGTDATTASSKKLH